MSASIIHYTACPVCQGRQLREVLQCQDHTVSHQTFAVWECNHCRVRFTQHVPAAESIGPYYQSEDYISHSDTDKGLVSKIYKLARRFTLRGKRVLVQQVSGRQQGTLLDVGCGTGAFLHTMQAAGWQVTGLEPDGGARTRAFQLYGLQVQEASLIYRLPDAQYDVITLWHVLEHIHDLHGYWEQFARLLRPGGTLLIAVPNFTSRDASEYQQYWAAYDVPRHLYHFSPQSMQQLAAQHGFSISAIRPMWLDAFYIALLSEKYRHGRQRLVPAFLAGCRSVWHAYRNPGTCSSQVYVLKRQ
ncbi:MAG: class I SAM-dependent methyltransferase [Chitinophagaceae bacterium]|jgi:SAM-dependent methyltransferase|nr:class I SAM-dependent methyltransferase [Chitinophagaceae bacterium]